MENYREARAQTTLDEVSFGYTTVTLHPAEELESAQAGYEGGDWRETWLAIGHEDLTGDPLFVDTADDALPVYTAMHGEGSWEPTLVADSFSGFVTALETIAEAGRGRENPVQLESNPLPEEERERVLQAIAEANPGASMEFWAGWLES
jgi:hypothetical protein